LERFWRSWRGRGRRGRGRRGLGSYMQIDDTGNSGTASPPKRSVKGHRWGIEGVYNWVYYNWVYSTSDSTALALVRHYWESEHVREENTRLEIKYQRYLDSDCRNSTSQCHCFYLGFMPKADSCPETPIHNNEAPSTIYWPGATPVMLTSSVSKTRVEFFLMTEPMALSP
jgi:hypothetical protein